MSGAFEPSGITSAVFWLVSAFAIGCAICVVTVRNVFWAAGFLAATFFALGAIYFMLSGEFVGVVQIIVYVGGVAVLIVFALFMIRDVQGGSERNRFTVPAALLAVLVVLTVWYVARETDWRTIDEAPTDDVTAALVGYYSEREVDIDGDGSVDRVELREPGIDAERKPGMLGDSTGMLGELLVQNYILAFEVVGLVLVGALIGALVLVRQERKQ